MEKVKMIVAFSGGKDSQATLLWAIEESGFSKNAIEAVFCDTGWEHEITYVHTKLLCEELGIKLHWLKSKKYDGMVDMAIKRSRFPSSKARFCTEQLKTIPMIDWILDQDSHMVIVQGIRADESAARAKMQENCRFFRFYFEPYVTNTMIVEALQGRENLSMSQKEKLKKAQARLALGKDDAKYHTYRKKEVFKWLKSHDDSVIRPFFKATGQEVIQYSLDRGHKLNELYYKGFGRVGCFPCVMSTLDELRIMINNPEHKEYIDRIIEAEKTANSSFFGPKTIPSRYQTGVDKNGKKFPKFTDIMKYLAMPESASLDLFKEVEQPHRCMSAYSICE